MALVWLGEIPTKKIPYFASQGSWAGYRLTLTQVKSWAGASSDISETVVTVRPQ